MPFALLIALAASLGIHAAALFGPDIDLSTEPASPPLEVELRSLPIPPPQLEAEKPREKPKSAKNQTPRRKVEAVARATPVLSVPDPSSVDGNQPETAPIAEPATESSPEPEAPLPAPVPESAPAQAPVEPRLPPRGMIRYRVDRGDSNFEIGVSQQEWEIIDGRYRLYSVSETTGLVWLFKAYRFEMESRGSITDEGLRPESFAVRRNGKETKEKASFDWENMQVRVGDRAEQALAHGAQDLLSFTFQLGFMPHPESGATLPVTNGRKYVVHHLEVLGDEEIEVPAGIMRTLHIRAPGVNIELWLAYDHLLLPVKIRQEDANGDIWVQVATQIQLSPP